MNKASFVRVIVVSVVVATQMGCACKKPAPEELPYEAAVFETKGETAFMYGVIDHESHAMFLDFYREMEIPEDFYWFTLEAAPPQRIHWMSDEEILLYDLVTDAVQ